MSKKAPALNTITIAGNIVKDLELKTLGENKTSFICFTVANNHSIKDKSGNWTEETVFFDVEAWGSMAERVGKGAGKGSPVIIEGSLKQNKWQDSNGNTHSKLLIKAEKIYLL